MSTKPKPIYFAREEGGELLSFHGGSSFYPGPGGEGHAIYFADGSQFDFCNGWRKPNEWMRPIIRVPMGRAVV